LPDFLRSKFDLAVTLLLVLQGVLLYSAIRPEVIPSARPLAELPSPLGWDLQEEGVIEPEILAMLNADDVLNRSYRSGNRYANLFVASFWSQRTGKAPHSPKNCLPGSGWTPLASSLFSFDADGTPITVNRYVVTRGDARSLVLYWYQSRDRVVADEYTAKFWVMADSIRLNRTDTALVRVVVPIFNGNEKDAEQTSVEFVRAFYATLKQYLPA